MLLEPPVSGTLIGILGGTFDPIHYGHLRLAEEVGEALDIAQLRLIPAGQPPHRGAPRASPAERLAMTRLAIEGNARLALDDREVNARGQPSYTVTTLEAIRADIGPQQPLALLMGADAFAGFASWHRWQDFAGLTHLVVTTRPGHDATAALDTNMREAWLPRVAGNARRLHEQPCGCLYFQPITALDLSASGLREMIAAGRSTRYLLPEPVRGYIEANGLYRT